MIYISIILIAIGLSFDSLSVSMIAAAQKNTTKILLIRLAIVLGIIQAGFTIGGYYAGNEIVKFIEKYDHWVAFILLMIIGSKMIIESLKKSNEDNKKINLKSLWVLITLGIATSIDAAIVGISLPIMKINIWISAAIIFVVTFLFSIIGAFSGIFISKKLKTIKIDIIGGLVLIFIGIKTLIEHL